MLHQLIIRKLISFHFNFRLVMSMNGNMNGKCGIVLLLPHNMPASTQNLHLIYLPRCMEKDPSVSLGIFTL